MSQGLQSAVAGAALAAPAQTPAQPQQPAVQQPQQPAAAPAQQQPPAQQPAQQPVAAPAITPEQWTAYQQQLQGYVQQMQAAHTQELGLRLALIRAGIYHDGYLDYAVNQYNALAPSTRPKPGEWVPQFQAQYPAFFGQPPVPPGGQTPGAPGNPAPPAAAPPGAPPPGWPQQWGQPAAPPATPPPGWPAQPPPQQGWPGYPQQQPQPQGPVWNAAAQRWEGPPPAQAAPTWQPAQQPPAFPQLPAPPWQPAPPAAPPAPAGWPQMFRPNPDGGATGAQGAGAIDPPLTEDLILKMDPNTMARRWTEVEQFMRSRGKR